MTFEEFLVERSFKKAELTVGDEVGGGIYIGNFHGEDLIIDTEYYILPWEEAKLFCVSSRANGYMDWYLPSKEEVIFLLNQKVNYKVHNNDPWVWANEEIQWDGVIVDMVDGTTSSDDKTLHNQFMPFRKLS